MNLVMKEVEGQWFFKGEADLERDYQNFPAMIERGVEPTAGQMVDLLLAKYPISRIRVESNADNMVVDANGKEWYTKDLEDYQRKQLKNYQRKERDMAEMRKYFDGVE